MNYWIIFGNWPFIPDSKYYFVGQRSKFVACTKCTLSFVPFVRISYRWGKPIRLLEVAIAAAATDFDETMHGNGTVNYGSNSGHTFATGDDDDFD